MSDAGERSVIPFPKWHNIDEWCDLPKGRRDASMADWLGSSDYNFKRVEAAIESGSELPAELQITTPDGYSPAAHLAKLVAWRRAAAEQDREQKERLERYLERKSLEQRVTLTAKGYRAVRELDRETEDAAQASAGEHSSPTKRTRSVA